MCRAPSDAAVSAIMAHVDALLAQKGLLDRSSCLFRGCSVCVVRLPEPEQAKGAGEGTELLSCALDMHAAAEASRRHLAPWDAKQLALQVSVSPLLTSRLLDIPSVKRGLRRQAAPRTLGWKGFCPAD